MPPDEPLPTGDLDELLDRQSGVLSRRQAQSAGLQPHDLRRLVRQRDLVRLHSGILINHTGVPTWLQRAWCGVLHAWPAALCDESAIRAEDGPGRRGGDDSVIHVAIDRTRNLAMPQGFRLHHLSHLDERVRWNLSPPRVRIEEALLDVAARRSEPMDAIATFADAVQARRTTAGRIRDALDQRVRVAGRGFLAGVLDDIALGTCSVLEHGYLEHVERPHGLPWAARQLRDSVNGPTYRDVWYVDFDQVVELDGRLWHDSAAARDADLERDLDAAVDRQHTVRLGWGQVFRTGCHTAARVSRLLRARGWDGEPHPCAECAAGWPLAC